MCCSADRVTGTVVFERTSLVVNMCAQGPFEAEWRTFASIDILLAASERRVSSNGS